MIGTTEAQRLTSGCSGCLRDRGFARSLWRASPKLQRSREGFGGILSDEHKTPWLSRGRQVVDG